MPPRLTENPYLAQLPDYGAGPLRAVYATLATNDRPVETIIAELEDAWAQDNNARKAAWDTQVEEDREAEARERLERETVAAEAAAAEKKEREKKKPKLKAFTTNKLVGTLASRRPPKYALHKLEQFKYVELYYFTKEACLEAERTDQTVAKDAFTFTADEGQMVMKPAAAHRPFKNVIQDENLGWDQMIRAKDHMLTAMEQADWPHQHTLALGLFFLELARHPMHDQESGKPALLIYQARVRRRWMDDLKGPGDDEVFDISAIDSTQLNLIYNEVLTKRQVQGIRRYVKYAGYF